MAENTAAGTDIGTPVRATDPENDTLEYTLEGTDAASFDIDPDTGQLQTKTGVNYDHEAKSSYSVTVAVNDGYGGTDTIAVTVNVTDVAEKPARPATPMVTAKPGTTDSLNVSWTKPDLAGGPEIVGYKVRHRVTGSGDWTELTSDPTDTMATIPGLQSGTGYSVQVQAEERRNAERLVAGGDRHPRHHHHQHRRHGPARDHGHGAGRPDADGIDKRHHGRRPVAGQLHLPVGAGGCGRHVERDEHRFELEHLHAVILRRGQQDQGEGELHRRRGQPGRPAAQRRVSVGAAGRDGGGGAGQLPVRQRLVRDADDGVRRPIRSQVSINRTLTLSGFISRFEFRRS